LLFQEKFQNECREIVKETTERFLDLSDEDTDAQRPDLLELSASSAAAVELVLTIGKICKTNDEVAKIVAHMRRLLSDREDTSIAVIGEPVADLLDVKY